MFKRGLRGLWFLFLLTWLISACSPEIKMVSRAGDGTATRTPFLPKAAFTSTYTPISTINGTELVTPSPTLPTTDGPLTQTAGAGTEGLNSPTPTGTLTPTGAQPGLTATASQTMPAAADPPTLTSAPWDPTQTQAPTSTTAAPPTAMPGNTSVPTHTSVPTNTLLPSNTPPSTITPLPTATAVPAVCSPAGNASYENQVVNLINQERTSRGLSALSQNSSLRAAARGHSEDMACNDFFSHTGSDGSSLSSRILAAGYSYSWAAENIAASSSCSFSASSVVNMWMNSSGHRANILSENAVHIGVGFRCFNDGISGDLDAYYTANFGRP